MLCHVLDITISLQCLRTPCNRVNVLVLVTPGVMTSKKGTFDMIEMLGGLCCILFKWYSPRFDVFLQPLTPQEETSD